MGAWGAGNFENDTAADWIAEVAEDGDADDVREALQRVAEAEEYIEAPDGCEALAAAEVVAAARGNPLPDEEDVVTVAQRLPELADDVELARRAVAAIFRPEGSELYDLWAETGEDDAPDPEWVAAVEDLRKRLGA